jgi:hypothetical protein
MKGAVHDCALLLGLMFFSVHQCLVNYLLHLLTAGLVAVSPFFKLISGDWKVHSQNLGISSVTNAGNLVEHSGSIPGRKHHIVSCFQVFFITC